MPQLQARMQRLLEVVANVLEDGKDYGKIPGTDKPALYKPGAEKLCVAFELAPVDPNIDDLSTLDAVRYRLHVPIEAPSGRVIAVGIGEASTNEEKYRWKRAVCDEEFDETPADCRREKWARGQSGGKPYKTKQVRTSPADLANTVLKMAHKRALIHGTLLATAASSVFNQDLEDFSDELRSAIVDAETETTPKKDVKRASETGGKKATPPTVAPTSVLVTEPRKVKDVVEREDRNKRVFHVITLDGDEHEYTTRDNTLATECYKFRGTDHLIRISYKTNEYQGRKYFNIENFAIADAAIPGARVDDDSLTAADIPFDK